MYIAFFPVYIWSLSPEALKHFLKCSESESTEVDKDWFISIYDVYRLYQYI